MNILTYRIFMEYLYIILYEMLFLFLFQLVDHKRRLGYTCRAKGSAEWGKIQQKVTGNWQSLIATQGVKIQ